MKPIEEVLSECKTIEDLSRHHQERDVEVKRLRAERRKANTDLRFEEASDMSDKLEDLIRHRFNLERNAERKAADQATAYHAAFSKSEARANELYEFAGNPESPGFKRMVEIDRELEAETRRRTRVSEDRRTAQEIP